jgi:hypothetical protein
MKRDVFSSLLFHPWSLLIYDFDLFGAIFFFDPTRGINEERNTEDMANRYQQALILIIIQ